MENPANNTLSRRDLYYILFSHKASIVVLFSAMVLTVFAGLYIWPESYQVSAKLLMKLGRENVTIPTVPASSQQQVITTGLTKEDVLSEIKMIENRFIIEKVVEKLGVDFLFPKATKPKTLFKKIKFEIRGVVLKMRDFIFEILYTIDFKKRLSPREKAVVAIQKKLSAEQVRDSDVIEVRIRWFSPDIGTEVLDTLINFYLEHHLETHKTSGGHEFFQKQVEILGKRLRDSEDALQLLKERQGIPSYEHQRTLLLEQTNYLRASLKETQTELAEGIAKISELRKQLSMQAETEQLAKEVKRNPIVDVLKRTLLELELEKKNLEAKYLENSPLIDTVNKQIQKVNNELEEEQPDVIGTITMGSNTIYKEAEKDLLLQEVLIEALNARKEKLEEHIESRMKELEKLSAYDTQLKRLNRQIQISEENYLLYRRKLEEARISDILDNERIVNVRVIDPVTSSFTPITPRKLLILSLGVMLALIVTIGFAFISEYLDHSIKTAEDIKRYLDLPLLASIQEMKR
ncbi:MAG: hypothetical protein KAV87_43455 [Desulfobacteraceae bacterium]|nr:hypothetical protein [Desulfobacteraceae bacterium]